MFGRNEQAKSGRERQTRMVQYGRVQHLQGSAEWISLANKRTSGSGHQRALSQWIIKLSQLCFQFLGVYAAIIASTAKSVHRVS